MVQYQVRISQSMHLSWPGLVGYGTSTSVLGDGCGFCDMWNWNGTSTNEMLHDSQ